MAARLARLLIAATLLACLPALAQLRDPGVSATEIVIGQTMPLSGPVSAAGTVGLASVAYFEALNHAGGINGRKVKLLMQDDGYSPPKAVEMTRKLVEDDQVFLMFGSVGTPTNAAVQKYLNTKKVPQLFVATGADRFKDPKQAPWTLSLLPSYEAEGKAIARYIVGNVPDPKIAVIFQNDDLGKDFLRGFRSGLGEKAASLLVSEQSFEVTDPTLSSQMIAAKTSGANVLFYAGTQKHGAIQFRARYGLSWNPLHAVCSTSSSIETVLRQAGFETAEGVLSTAYSRDPYDPQFKDDADVKAFLEWQKAWLPSAKAHDTGVVLGYQASALLQYVLEQAGQNLTRDNVMKISTNLAAVKVPLLLPGITINTSPSNYHPIKQFQIQRFEKGVWKPIGSPIAGE